MYRTLLILLLLSLVASCSARTSEPATDPQVTQQAAMTPLEQYVAQAKPGGETFILGTQYGDVRVVVHGEYYSATGKTCRAVEMRLKGGCTTDLAVCQEADGSWKELPPLLDKCVR